MAAFVDAVREYYPKPQHPLQPISTSSRSTRVVVKHPGYSDYGTTLFTLSACDGPNGDRVDYDTLHAACAIVARNRFDGWLSGDLLGKVVIRADEYGFIAAATYFFHIPVGDTSSTTPRQSDYHYPVVPNFRTWPFPHDAFPENWRQTENDGREAARRLQELMLGSQECRLTRHSLKVQRSHIIPSSEKQWFGANSMDQYGNLGGRGGQDVIDKSENIIPFRADIHQLWDDYQFVVVPRRKGNGSMTWTAHAMTNEPEVIELYHRVPLHPLPSPAEYLFARLAYDVFPKVLGFLQTGKPRWLWVPAADDPESLERRMCSGSECRNLTLDQGRGRSSSPMKRSRQDADLDSTVDEETVECHGRARKRHRKDADHAHSVDSGISGLSQDSSSARGSDVDDGTRPSAEREIDLGEKFDEIPTGWRRREESPDAHSRSWQTPYYNRDVDEESFRGRKRER